MKRKVPSGIGLTVGIVCYFFLGALVVVWLNAIMQPEFVLSWLFPDIFWQIAIRLLPSIGLLLFCGLLLLRWLKGIKSTWFFSVQALHPYFMLYRAWSKLPFSTMQTWDNICLTFRWKDIVIQQSSHLTCLGQSSLPLCSVF